MKFLFACILIVIALYLVGSQQGAIQSIKDNFASGKTQATIKGW
jgi:hypothetical protein